MRGCYYYYYYYCLILYLASLPIERLCPIEGSDFSAKRREPLSIASDNVRRE